ncbi:MULTISPECIES: hypothetical protein [unclassified Sphingomonas]|jgi:hypothetical protein|uniref:hypothetical protein n=1 Tax=unclassified Sphingomonas TaxID=196159 RepID=UPI000A8D8C9E|nr:MULTISPECIES: hypothetical protein [unclassified Sphingomonas]
MTCVPQILFLLLAAFDFASTRYATSRFGNSVEEENRLWRFLLKRHARAFDLLYPVGALALAGLSLWLPTDLGAGLMFGLIGAFLTIAVNNAIVLARLFRQARRSRT